MSERTSRLVIVTGGGTGMGRAIAMRFATDGDQVVILGRRAGVLAQTATALQKDFPQAQIFWRRCDVRDAAEVDACVKWLTTSVGPTVDILVNNAGGVSILADNAPTSAAATHATQMLTSNLISAYLIAYALRPHLRQPGARIVNISSIAAFRGGGGMYSAAKAGVVGLTYALAGELAPLGVTVNAVAPGLILGTEFFGDRMTAERQQHTVAQIPLGRPGAPEDVAAAVHYLASPAASYVTGETHHVNGGWLFGR